VLREDKKIELVRLPVTLPRMFRGRWAIQSAQKVYPDRWKDAQVEAWKARQADEPVCLRNARRKSLWWFRDRFYWDDDGHSADDVKALALQRLRAQERRLKSAHATGLSGGGSQTRRTARRRCRSQIAEQQRRAS
jgi:hypothetical protein